MEVDSLQTLSFHQTLVLKEICEKQKSGFITGAGGTGKSFLISQIIQNLQLKNRSYALTATTGIAAVLIGGITLHSLFRIFPDDLNEETLEKGKEASLNRIKNNRFFKKELAKIQVLIIDEVSMLDIVLFERIHFLLSYVHGNGAPFGGIQIILVGDFFQLPPIKKFQGKTFIFETSLFWETCQNIWELKEIFRQVDPIFTSLLNRIRIGEITKDDINLLNTRLLHSEFKNNIEPTKLFAMNVNVDALNKSKLNSLEHPSFFFKYYDGEFRNASFNAVTSKLEKNDAIENIWKNAREKFRREINISETLELKIGTQVMLSFNLDVSSGYCNGSRGIVIDFKESISSTATEDDFHIKKDLTYGEHRTLYLSKIKLPLVQFDDGKKMLIPYTRWSRKIPDLGEIYFWHLPLRYAWASTIHRMQGQTLSLVDASLDSSVFEVGQAYVATSRCRTFEGLYLSSFDPKCIKANEKVKRFYSIPFELQKLEILSSSLTVSKPTSIKTNKISTSTSNIIKSNIESKEYIFQIQDD